MNTISIIDLEITCIIGILPNERVKEQTLLLNINLDVDIGDSTFADNINETIDYTKIAEMATQLGISKKYKLIESFCYDLNNLFLDTFKIIQQSKITVKKPNAIPKAKYAAYSMKKIRI
jgi:dihydroneopterin aldolase